MRIDVSTLTETELRAQLEKHLRLFDVAYGALLRLSSPGNNAEAIHKDAADTLAILDRYPDHPLFSSAATGTR
ncbi:MAG: hypothetical protein QM756_05080 [Polyangiaceae bacterium]